MSRPGLTNERLLAAFLLGVLLFTPPFIGIFNVPRLVLGIPLLYLYCFLAWLLVIGLAALIMTAADGDDETRQSVPANTSPIEDDVGG